MAFCLIPEILSSVNMVMIFSKMRTMIDAKMTKLSHIKYIITGVSVRVNGAIRLELLSNNGQ
ncbi:hypothetical protein SCC4092_0203640 [Aggregatibacter actinomycetemcomitans serotype b str. SCC4092]|nr:hypothetical protein ANH9381_0587 [Aggregatibacter actinomycetemcomitans ANH9381]ANN81527.1 hypothetical protein D11S_02285 [Aggregatibacter actinomycetemcomitans D11S-1]KND82857.1 hypothetical protein SCC1398_0207360 [Aggregatibacter actinomycetemcomitans serotype b str. SCC1398]KOE54518.1 hypothetical protein I23C_0303540 [Aggregatibacter actinomycetemcomitans serotype b str. I23C]KOE54974.1 hypothetical protein SCC4092_0203640 [Aggregatibacter actinomycetemcomitans serotype b str. SCC4092